MKLKISDCLRLETNYPFVFNELKSFPYPAQGLWSSSCRGPSFVLPYTFEDRTSELKTWAYAIYTRCLWAYVSCVWCFCWKILVEIGCSKLCLVVETGNPWGTKIMVYSDKWNISIYFARGKDFWIKLNGVLCEIGALYYARKSSEFLMINWLLPIHLYRYELGQVTLCVTAVTI